MLQTTYKPGDYSDIGQATQFAKLYEDRVLYSKGIGFLFYNGSYWEESELKVRAAYQEFSENQLEEAAAVLTACNKTMEVNGATSQLKLLTRKAAEASFNAEQKKALELRDSAEAYHAFASKRRNSHHINACLKELAPMIAVDPSKLDADPFLLNTPSWTIDLRTGEYLDHSPGDLMTRCTSCDPGEAGKELWDDALKMFFGDDEELKMYVQLIAGQALIGRVFNESLVVCYGTGRNGKSTFWNSILSVAGTYGGGLTSEALTVGRSGNIKPELAELRGKRLVVAAELDGNARLNTAAIKRFCSTDEIIGERKFEAPFKFRPSHSLVLFTNHLPQVAENDEGTWRRLTVVPFSNVIPSSGEMKNYTSYLTEHAGPYILSWLIAGARAAIDKHYILDEPECIRQANNEYRAENDWLHEYIELRCTVGSGYQVSSGKLYDDYRCFCSETGLCTKSTNEFYSALAACGFKRKRTSRGRLIIGLRITSSD